MRFPLWLAPEQVRVLPISDKVADYSRQRARRAPGGRSPHDHRPPSREDRRFPRSATRSSRRSRSCSSSAPRRPSRPTVSYRDRIDGDRGAMPLDQAIAQLKAESEARTIRQTAPPAANPVATRTRRRSTPIDTITRKATDKR